MHAGQLQLMSVFLETNDPICLGNCLTPHPIPIMGQDGFIYQGRKPTRKINNLIAKSHCDQGNSTPPCEATRQRSGMPKRGDKTALRLPGVGLTSRLNASLASALMVQES
jgi:hypothetical protein